jgi:hypothetical protein
MFAFEITPEQRESKDPAKKLAAEAIIPVAPEFDGRKIPGRSLPQSLGETMIGADRFRAGRSAGGCRRR